MNNVWKKSLNENLDDPSSLFWPAEAPNGPNSSSSQPEVEK